MRAALPIACLTLTACSAVLDLEPPPQVVSRDLGPEDARPAADEGFDFRVPDFGNRDAFRIDVGPADEGPGGAVDAVVDPCDRCVNPLGDTECVDGACVPTCAPGAVDADGDPDNGCEQLVLSGEGCVPELTLPDTVTVVIQDLQICAMDAAGAGGRLVVRAGEIRVEGVVDGRGRGFPGGGGGGGGSGGDLLDQGGTPGRGGATPSGEAGRDGRTSPPGGSCGGDGGGGGAGQGPAGGPSGSGGGGGQQGGGCAQDGGAGEGGGDGGDGGYATPGANGDQSMDLSVWPGSGGGGGGGGGGCQAQAWRVCECIGQGSGGGGGGGGGAGSPGGAQVTLVASRRLVVQGAIHVDGLAGVGGDGARGRDGAEGQCQQGEPGGAGGDGGGAQGGRGRGGAGGNLVPVCGNPEGRVRGPAGDGGRGGVGAGGGVLLQAPDLSVLGPVTSLGGGDRIENGGTVKVASCGPLGEAPIQAGRLYVQADPQGCP